MDSKIFILQNIILLLFVFSVSLGKTECPNNYLQLHNKCYYFSNQKLPWTDAHFFCNEKNSSLAVLSNLGQYKRIRQYLLGRHLVPKEWWFGAKYDWVQKVWRWAESGKQINHTRFASKDQDMQWNCAMLDPHVQYRWSSTRCTDKHNFICQVKSTGPNTNTPDIVTPFKKTTRTDNARPNLPGYTKNHTVKRPRKAPRLICPRNYRHVKGSCYKFSKDAVSWNEAYFNCDSEYNGTLAIIPNKKTDVALRKAALRLGVKNTERWIGGRYDWEAMAWKWAVNGAVIQHQTFDRERLKWHCLIWNPLITDKWSSEFCMDKKHYICQTKGTSILCVNCT